MQQAGELSVELSYVVSNAEWKPIYDLRLVEEESGSQCEVTYLAQVAQVTGESWEGVQLALSTARPASSRTLPELQPWYVRPPAPPAPMPRAAAPMAFACQGRAPGRRRNAYASACRCGGRSGDG